MPSARDDLAELTEALEGLLAGQARESIVDGMCVRGGFSDWLRRIRTAMSEHAFAVGERRIDLHHTVRRLDVRTRKDGFRVLHAWNHTSHRFTEDIVPVLLIDFFQRANPTEPNERFVIELLLDYYLFHLLALCAMRVWDADDPDTALSHITELVTALQGEHGSGHQFVADGETVLIYALSQFHPEEQAYDHLIEKVGTLDEGHRLAFARVSAAVLSAHLRWGFWLMYGRDVVRMRDDNVGDYPWLLISVLWLMRGWVAAAKIGEERAGSTEVEREEILEALLQGLAADPWAFAGPAPPSLEGYRAEYDELRALLGSHGEALLESLDEAHKPTKTEYAPLALHFNFPHNTLVAIVTLALLEGRPQSLPLNALFRRQIDEAGQEAGGTIRDAEAAEGAAPDGDTHRGETQEGLARTLMAFSSGSPDRLGHRGAMLVAFDPLSAMRSFSMTTKALRKSLTST